MDIVEKGHTLILKNDSTKASLDDFAKYMEQQYEKLSLFNVVVDLNGTTQGFKDVELLRFESVAEKFHQCEKSFVLVTADIDFNEFDEELIVVPTLQEAFDLIEMDEIQRDLGF